MPYILKRSQIARNSRESIIIGPLTSTELLINFVNLNPSGRFIDEVSSFRWERDGKIGRKISLFFGETEHFLDVPGAGDYFLKLFPSRYTFHFQIEVYEMELETDLTALALKTGISESFLRLQNSQIIQLLTGIDEIMSTDIRATKQAIADNLAATQAAQLAASNAQLAADNAQSLSSVNSSGIQDAITNMNQIAGLMVQKFGPASIAASAFTLNAASGYYEYVLTHNLNDEAPEVNVVDAQRERQLIQDTGIDENSVKLELAPEDMTSNAWPLYVTVLGKPGSTIPNANLFKQIQPAGAWYRLLNGTLDYSLNGTTVDVPMVFLTVSEAFMLTIPGTVWVKLANGTYYTFNGATPELPATETTQAVFDSRIGFPDRVAL